MRSKTRKLFPFLPFILSHLWKIISVLKVAVNRALAPLRIIKTRELVIFERQRFGTPHPSLFAVVDTLECGHRYVSNLWSFPDLINGYQDSAFSPHVTARRHRCHVCRDLALAKKPVRSSSVGILDIARRSIVALLVLVAITAGAQEFKGARTVSPKFFDRARVVSTSLNFAARTYDVVDTCRALGSNRGFREEWLPSQSCGGVSLISYGFAFASVGAERLLYKRHRKLARIPQWISFGGAAAGIAYSVKRGGI